MLGRQSAEEVKLHYRHIAKDGVEFRQETVTGVDAAARRAGRFRWRESARLRPRATVQVPAGSGRGVLAA
jgi:hypothetical protein